MRRPLWPPRWGGVCLVPPHLPKLHRMLHLQPKSPSPPSSKNLLQHLLSGHNLPLLRLQRRTSIKISRSAIDSMSKPFQFSIIGKFSHGRPTMERSRSVFGKLGLKDVYFLGHLDPKHMLIRIQDKGDFNRLWLREVWFLDGFLMRTFNGAPIFS